MNTHTQGKWHIGKRAADVAVYGEKGEEIAKILGFFNSDEENKANARLIAAAPELLAALRGLMSQAASDAEIYAPDGSEPIWAWIADASDIIAKARGDA